MSKVVPPFKVEALEQLGKVFGDFFTGSEITRLFQLAGYPDEFVGGTKWRSVVATFEKFQERDRAANAILAVVSRAVDPQRWIQDRDRFESLLHSFNSILAFYGLRLYDDGRIVRTGQQAVTVSQARSQDEKDFDARDFHAAVRQHGRAHFCRGAYFHAVFECCKAFDSAVRTALNSGKSGQSLMTEAMGLNGPVKLNSQRTQSERDEQQGVMYLCMGLMNAVRNPQAHEPELHWPMKREDALDVLGLMSFLFRKLETAMVVDNGNVSRIAL